LGETAVQTELEPILQEVRNLLEDEVIVAEK
jgi:hypothetical protein